MQTNALYFASVMRAQGWSLQAISACFGNWESEATLNTNRPQYSEYPNPRSNGNYGGFGLPQWTSWHDKYYWWGSQYNLQFTRDNNATAAIFENQLEYHDFECTYGLHGDSSRKTWFQRSGHPYMPWADFKVSTNSPNDLAVLYYWVYEYSGALDPGSRGTQADKWYTFLTGSTPPGPEPPTPSKYNFLYGGKRKWPILFRLPI